MITSSVLRLPALLLLSFLYFISPAQTPQLTIKDKNANVYLQSLKLDIKVTGNIAITTMEMTFFNKTSRILEGELVFPLPEGSSVSRYAIDINGKMREAVPVEKQKGTQVFEAIEHRRVDPGLLEKTEGNNFRTRIYPIPANGSRTVLIAYEEELLFNNDNSLRYHLPLDYKKAIDNFRIDISVLQSSFQPKFDELPDNGIEFKEWNNNYSASMERKDFIPGHAVGFNIPKSSEAAEVMMQQVGASYYFLINTFLKKDSRPKQIPGNIAVVWDISLSGLGRNIKKELQLLDAYIEKKKNLVINLATLNTEFKKAGEFNIQNGNWDELKKTIENFSYDGGTNYSKINLNAINSNEYLLFSDGLSTLSNPDFPLPSKPVYTINSSPRADYSFLQSVAQKTGAASINLNELKTSEAIKLLTEQPLQLLCIKQNADISETYPSLPQPVSSNTSIAGISTNENTVLTLQYGYGNKITFEKTVQLNYNKHQALQVNIQKVWAQKKIAELDIDYERNKEIISQLSKHFSIVTRNTSLIVLENVMDYVQYEIEPPAELRNAYDRIIKERIAGRQTQQVLVMNNAFRYFEDLMQWWDKDFKPLPLLDPIITVSPDDNAGFDSSIPVGVIKGRVLTTAGNALAGATVTFKGTHTSTITNTNGFFQINKQGNASMLVFSAIGMRTTEIRTGNNNNINIKLMESSQALRDVVVVGYGTRRADSNDEERETGRDATHTVAASKTAGMEQVLEGRVSGTSVSAAPGNRNSVRLSGINSFSNDKKAKEDEITDDGFASINIKQWTPERVYLKTIAKTSKEKQYLKYLELRNEYLSTPSFYFDMACFFFQQKDSGNGFLILSNLAELDMENHELYKLLGFKLKETGNYNEEAYIYRKVLQWRPQEPQSYRDYGLALADAGLYQQALDTLYSAISKQYDGNVMNNYNGIEEVIVTEINQLLTLHADKLDISKIDRKLLHSMPVDIRVVLSWNMNDTDIDLWVTDPNAEKCYYSHKNTAIGGRISNDFTSGYGPEQFLLKKAVKGKYKIEVDFYGERQVKLAGPTTVMAEIYTHYANGRQERKIITVQLEKNEHQDMLVGEFSFDK
jgi:Vault protein inter-alpha-trypsin domain/CarboxypepD_reg-like domain/Uncharacterized protein conserved in bacteria (DUF2135)